jgi:20S proteasome alpha/beta subunit
MSIGIAAICKENDAGRIVACMDTKVSTDSTSAETEVKWDYLNDDIRAIFAGKVPYARELIGIYRNRFRDTPFDWDHALEQLRIPPQIFKWQKCEAYTQSRLGIPYERFLKDGKKEIASSVHQRMTYDLDAITTDVDLIIFGFEKTKPRLFKFSCDELWEESIFACIGTGEEAAKHSLSRRKQKTFTSLARSLYNIWEAKKLSELSPTVGQRTITLVLEPGLTPGHRDWRKHCKFVTSTGKKFLNEQYGLYGPKDVPPDFVLPDGTLL